MENEVVLKVEQLTKRFGGVTAVDHISFELEKGDFLGLIGPNGSGKTTLINLITGFVKPTSGKIVYHDVNIKGKPPYTIACLGIARSFQMVRTFHKLPAFKNLIVPLYSPRVRKFGGGKYGDRDDIAIDLLDDLGFERDSFVPYKIAGSLPHGYLKRLDLARCIALRPDLLILDELFSGMTMSEVAATLPMIEKFNREGLTIVMAEHRLKELFRVANRVIVLNFGQKIADGPPKEAMGKEAVQKAYLGTEGEG
jgi:ABC-type branched-subunit amino acid transport system ATPase component